MGEPNLYDKLCDDVRRMIGISEDDFVLLNQQRDFFLRHAEALVGYIVKVLSDHPETRAVFESGRGDADRLAASVANWLVEVLESHDTPETWRRQYRIGLEHIQRKIPNRHMMALATRIRELVLPIMLDELGPEEGTKLFLAFQRFLDTIVALTATLVDEGQQQCLMRSTGFTPVLIERLQATVFEEIAAELRGES